LFIPQQYKRLTMKFKNGWQIVGKSRGCKITNP
jgi:hypothetical protein